jgi:hypothetical protein
MTCLQVPDRLLPAVTAAGIVDSDSCGESDPTSEPRNGGVLSNVTTVRERQDIGRTILDRFRVLSRILWSN